MTLFQRVRSALEPDYDVHREIGRGGMGVVYEAMDRRLDHRVAIKVLRPELATARAEERFRREAKALAAVEHPSVVRIHRAGEAAGLLYYVMEHVEGETLAERLRRGPLTPRQRDALTEDLLAGLAAIHQAGIVHRDVKPSNIFLVDGRARLGDFGIMTESGDGTDGTAQGITRTGELVGTPAYLAPEQWDGDAGTAADVYAAGLALYESCAGTHWRDRSQRPWTAVPRKLRRPLKRALSSDPANRPADGAAFLAEVRRVERRMRRERGLAVAVMAALAIAAGFWFRDGEPEPPTDGSADLAILPFDVVGGPADDEVGRNLWQLTTLNLQGLEGLNVIPPARVAHLAPAGSDVPPTSVRDDLNAATTARGTVLPDGDRLVLHLTVRDAGGQPVGEVRVGGTRDDLYGTADSAALALVRIVIPRLASSYRRLEALHTDNFRALRAFLHGEDAFNRNAWTRAEDHYRTAVAEDSSFALAKWRLWFVHHWSLTGEEQIDLDRLYRNHADELGTVDAALLRARALPPGPARIDSLERVARRLGHSSYPWFLLGDEHYHRGPLGGGSLEEAAAYLAEAVVRDPEVGPVHEHRVMVLIRLGRRTEALAALDALRRTANPSSRSSPFAQIPVFLAQAVRERFLPDSAAQMRDRLYDASDPALQPALMVFARMGLSLDVPEGQRQLGARLVGAAQGASSLAVQGHRAQALALLALGRPRAALVHMDAAVAGDIGASLEAAEWRVLAPALDIQGVPAAERDRGRRWLAEQVDAGSEVAGRAAWALAIEAWYVGDHGAGRRWHRTLDSLENEPERSRLIPLASAFAALAQGQYQRVLASTEPLLAEQYAPDQGYPFTRTALHVVRARALEALGDTARARTERAWADNQDVAFQLIGPLQAVEVDWVVSPYSDRERARLALALADTADACHLLGRVERFWTDAEPALDSLRARDARLRDQVCP